MSPPRDPSPNPSRVVRTPGGHWAFVPEPLPPILNFDATLILRLAEAERSLGRLADLGSRLPSPEFPTRLLLRRETILSSRLDNLRTSCLDLVLFEARPRGGPSDECQVANHLQALEHGLGACHGRPVTLKLIRVLHRILMKGVRSEHQMPGQFRKTRRPVDPPGCMEPAALLPPPVREMRTALAALEKHLREPSDIPPLIRVALVHSQFETIHPFLEGNDRVGRMLIALLLRAWGLLPWPWLCLSAHFVRHREEYYGRLVAAGEPDEWEGWVGFFLRGVAHQSRDSLRRVLEMQGLRINLLARLRRSPFRLPLAALVEGLFERPTLTVVTAARQSRVTKRVANSLIHRLVDAEILSAEVRRDGDVVFVARDIVRTIEDNPRPGRS